MNQTETYPETTLTREALAARVATIPRVPLACTPTPLQRCARLGEAIGGVDLLVKRDDLTGLAFGGNKTRQLEFLFADILSRDVDVVVAGAYTQSNWCRQISAAACRLGLEASLVLMHGEKGPARQGNLLLDEILGAEVEMVDVTDIHDLVPYLERKCRGARREVGAGRTWSIRLGSKRSRAPRWATWRPPSRSMLSSRCSACEADQLYVAGANMTPAGLALGMRALGRRTRVVGITPIQWEEDRQTDIARIASATARLLGIDFVVSPSEIINDDAYIGERYGVVTPEGPRSATPGGTHRGADPRSRLHLEGPGRAHRSRAPWTDRPGRRGGLRAHRRHPGGLRLRRRPARRVYRVRALGARARNTWPT